MVLIEDIRSLRRSIKNLFIALGYKIVRSSEKQAFYSTNCGAIQSELVDSELFGHKKGAFIGADNNFLYLRKYIWTYHVVTSQNWK